MTGSGEETAITYRTGEQVELEDIVMQPENGDTMGVILDVLQNAEKAMKKYGISSSGVVVKWDSWETEVYIGPDVLQSPDEVLFVRRKNESPKTLTYRSGEHVELEDIVMRMENSNTKGVVVKVILPFSPDSIWYEVRLGGVVVKWGSLETEGTLSSDVLREEVYLVFRNSE